MKFTWDIALVIFLIHFFGYIIKCSRKNESEK